MDIDEALAIMIRATKRSRMPNEHAKAGWFERLVLISPEEIEALELLLNCDTYDSFKNPVASAMERLVVDLSEYIPYSKELVTAREREIANWKRWADVREFMMLYFRLKNYLDREMPREGGRYRYVVKIG